MEHIQIPSSRKSKPIRLGKMSSKSWDRAAQIICDVLTESLCSVQSVQTLTLNSSSLNSAGVLTLLDKLVAGVNVFGIHEFSYHYGEASDEFLCPMFSDHMRLIVWSENAEAVSEFCALYAALTGTPEDWLFNLPVCREMSVKLAIEWIAQYAKSPIANYEGSSDPDFEYEARPTTAHYGTDDIYKSPCYRWREKRHDLDRRTAHERLGDFVLAHGEGARIKDAVLLHRQLP